MAAMILPRRGSGSLEIPSTFKRPVLGRLGRSDERNFVGAADCPAFDDVGVDADIRMIVLRCGAQDAGIFGEVSLRQRGHDATSTRARDPLANLVADRARVADP